MIQIKTVSLGTLLQKFLLSPIKKSGITFRHDRTLPLTVSPEINSHFLEANEMKLNIGAFGGKDPRLVIRSCLVAVTDVFENLSNNRYRIDHRTNIHNNKKQGIVVHICRFPIASVQWTVRFIQFHIVPASLPL